MVSPRGLATAAPLARCVRAAALAALMLAAPADGVAQAEPEHASTAAQRAIIERIELIRAQSGPRSADLIAPLTALAVLYEEGGELAFAAAAVELATDLVRINYGVQSLDQATLLRRRIALEEERGNFLGAWNLEQALVALARRHRDDPRTVTILHEIGDKRMHLLERYFDGEFPPQVVFGCYYSEGQPETISAPDRRPFGDCAQGSRGTVLRSVLWEAQMHYSDAIKVGLGNDLYGSTELREIEMDIVRGSFEYGAIFQDNRDYALGRESLRRLAAYEAASDAPPLIQIEALIAIADWDLVFSTSGKLAKFALETYERAHDRLRTSGQPNAVIEALFAPAAPVVLPTFLPSPFERDESGAAFPSFEVAFEVTKEGKARNVEVRTKGASRADERRVHQAIMRGRYRPRLVDGRFADATPVVVRYWLAPPADEAEEQ